jgi:type IV pilus assembly protein PilA
MVMAVILVIASIALPNLMRARMTASESSAVSTLRLLNTAQNQYASTYDSFSADLPSLGPIPPNAQPTSSGADLVDAVLSGQVSGKPLQFDKSGYHFTYTPVGSFPAVRQFAINADPLARGTLGQRSFYMDQSGIIRWNGAAPANTNDNPLL